MASPVISEVLRGKDIAHRRMAQTHPELLEEGIPQSKLQHVGGVGGRSKERLQGDQRLGLPIGVKRLRQHAAQPTQGAWCGQKAGRWTRLRCKVRKQSGGPSLG